jgi:RNA polymerase sigma-70 factor, ECF subfamily
MEGEHQKHPRPRTAMTDPSFARIYDEHVWDVYGFVGYRVNSVADAEDLTQLTFERAMRAWQRFDPARASARTWLLAIARNLVIDHYREARHEREKPLHGSDADLAAFAGSAHDRVAIGVAPDLASALESLTDRERELVALRYGGDLNGPEIAELTGLSLANVQQILSRALRRMRGELEETSEVEAATR